MIEHVKAEVSDLYALGAVDGEEKRAIEAHIRGCDPCAENIAWAHQRVALVGLASAPAHPSPAVREMVMRRLRAEGIVSRTEAQPARIAELRPQATEVVPQVPEAPRADDSAARQIRAEREPSPGRKAKPERAEESGSRAGWIAAGLILLVAAGALWTGWRQMRVLAHEAAVQQGQLATLQQQLKTARTRVQVSAEPTEHLLAATGTVRLVLNGSAGHAGVLYNLRTGTAVCSAQVAAPPAGKGYQLWLISTLGTPISMGMLSAADPATVTGQIKPGVEASAFIVTLEPQGGSPSPSGPRVLTGGDY
jgi:anti-sigma-K factor RskA